MAESRSSRHRLDTPRPPPPGGSRRPSHPTRPVGPAPASPWHSRCSVVESGPAVGGGRPGAQLRGLGGAVQQGSTCRAMQHISLQPSIGSTVDTGAGPGAGIQAHRPRPTARGPARGTQNHRHRLRHPGPQAQAHSQRHRPRPTGTCTGPGTRPACRGAGPTLTSHRMTCSPHALAASAMLCTMLAFSVARS